jgi:hypothetical protein
VGRLRRVEWSKGCLGRLKGARVEWAGQEGQGLSTKAKKGNSCRGGYEGVSGARVEWGKGCVGKGLTRVLYGKG